MDDKPPMIIGPADFDFMVLSKPNNSEVLVRISPLSSYRACDVAVELRHIADRLDSQ